MPIMQRIALQNPWCWLWKSGYNDGLAASVYYKPNDHIPVKTRKLIFTIYDLT